jgi:hypothetical protein
MSVRTPRLHVPMLKPRDVIPHLGKGEAHWQAAFSAHALATTWFKANAFPPRVQAILDGHDRFRGAELVDAILERKTDLRDGVRGPSQTDLLAILGIGSALAIAAVEGKVEETFGQLVSEWLGDEPSVSVSKGSKDKQVRLGRLKNVLDLEQQDVSSLRYQLLH